MADAPLKKLTGLWRSKSGKAYSVKLKADLNLKAGDRLVLCKIRDDDRKENGPDLELMLASDSAGYGDPPAERRVYGERRDAPEKILDPKIVDAAIRAQSPAGFTYASKGKPVPDEFGDEVPF